MPSTRRALLASTGLALVGGLAGCSGLADPGNETGPSDDRPGSSDPTAAPESGSLEASATVRDQPSAKTPGTIRAALTNGRSSTVAFGYGPRLFLSFRRPDAVALARERSRLAYCNGCWRLAPDAGTPTVISTSRDVRLEPGGTLEEVYHIYTPPETDGCLPPGSYEFQERIAPRDERGGAAFLRFVLRLTVAEDRRLSVETEGPIPET